MSELSKEEKKALLRQWKAEQNKKYVLSKTRVQKLFRFLEKQLEATSCDHTLKHTEQWLNKNLPPEKTANALTEMQEMGGYCDCEVLANCYERYDI